MEYYISDRDVLKAKKDIILDFLLQGSDSVRLTEQKWTELGVFSYKKLGGENDEKFHATLKGLEKDYVKKETNNKKYNDIEQPGKSLFTHYFYRLSDEIRDKFKNDPVLFEAMNLPVCFYGFDDPVFYKDEKMVGGMITHENMVFLSLSDEE